MDYMDIDHGAYDKLERSLIDPNTLQGSQQASVSHERRLFQNRRFIQQALSQQKRNRKKALSLVQQKEQQLVELDRKRRGHLLEGIKLRNKLEKLSQVQQMSTILLMQREIRRRKEQDDFFKKKEQYAHRRNSSDDRQELSQRIYNERRLRALERNKQEQKELEEEKMRLKELALEDQRTRVEKTRLEQARLKNRMKRYEAFKSARAMDNYNDKVLRLLDQQKMQEQTMRLLHSRESEQKEIMKKTQKLGKSSHLLEKMLEGRTFQLTTL